MRKNVLRAAGLAIVLLLAAAATAYALRIQVGPIVITTSGGFTPTTLPKHRNAPIKLHGYGKLSTDDGSQLPVLEELVIWFDKHGSVVTKGLPVCPKRRLVATTPAQARRNCRRSIVGKGFGEAVVNFPEQAPIPARSPITIFNGPPDHGNPTVYAHAYTTVGGPSTYIVQVVIQKVHDGRYGFKTVAHIPKIVNGYGTPTYGRLKIGREWVFKGKRLSYANASCPDGHLAAKGQFRFKNGTFMQGTLVKPCKGT